MSRSKEGVACPDNIKCVCTILLFVKKVKKFILLSALRLPRFWKFFVGGFRIERASLFKGWSVKFYIEICKDSHSVRIASNFLVVDSFWSIPFIIVYSIFWFTWNYLFYRDLHEGLIGPDAVGVNTWFDPIVQYFTSYEGYLNILILLIVVIGSAILGAFLKIKYRETYKKRSLERNEFS